MQCSSERKQLLDTMYPERVTATVILAKCAAGLAIIVLLVTMVASDGRVTEGPAARGATSPRAESAGVRAEEHRKQMFEARRQRFQSSAGRQNVAGQAAGAPNQSPAMLPQNSAQKTTNNN